VEHLSDDKSLETKDDDLLGETFGVATFRVIRLFGFQRGVIVESRDQFGLPA